MTRWEDALFEQVEQQRFLQSDIGMRYMMAVDDNMRVPQHDTDRDDELPNGWRMVVTNQTVHRAEPVFVAHDVCQIVEAAMESFQPEPVLPQDPFTLCGFALLSHPIKIRDARGLDIPIKAVGWLPMLAEARGDQGGMVLPGRETFTQEMVERSPGLWVTFWVSYDCDPHALLPENDGQMYDEQGRSVGQVLHDMNPHARLQMINSFYVAYGKKTWTMRPEDDPHGAAARAQWKLIQVLWRLGQQLVPVRERAARAARRDARRHNIEREHITVVKLRRASNPRLLGEGDGRQLDHRHIVHGHWKPVWYPSLGEHRQRYIMPYVRGPEDAPLRINDRVFEFVR